MSTVQPMGDMPGSLRERKKDRTRRVIQSEALRLFAVQGFLSTTVEQIAAAAEVAPRTFFRYFASKDEVVFWPEYQPMLAAFVAARPADEPAVEAVSHALVDGLAAFYDQDRDRVLERLTLAFRTPALHPRLWQQQARSALGIARALADRLNARPDELEVRAMAAAIAAALWVAVEEWQAHEGQQELAVLMDRAFGTLLTGVVRVPEAAVESAVEPQSSGALDRKGNEKGGTEMDEESRRAALERLVKALDDGETRPFDDIYDDDVVIEWPQSGEVIRGKQNIAELRGAYPNPPTATLRRIIGSGDLWAAEMIFDYDGDRYYTVLIHEYRNGLVARETCYYATPFEAPAWRAQWVEPETSSAPT